MNVIDEFEKAVDLQIELFKLEEDIAESLELSDRSPTVALPALIRKVAIEKLVQQPRDVGFIADAIHRLCSCRPASFRKAIEEIELRYEAEAEDDATQSADRT